MKSLSIFAFLLFASLLYSQEKPFQAEIGLNHSWFIYKIDAVNNVKAEFKPQIILGLNYTFYTFDNFALKGGIKYHDLYRYINMEPYGYGNGALSTFDNYLLSVPIQINYNIKIINTSAIINIEPSYILKSKTKTPSFIVPMNFETKDVSNEMNRLQLAIGIGLEYDFNLYNQRFGIKSIYNYMMTNIPKKGVFTDATGAHSWAEFNTTELNLLLTYYF